MISSEYMYSDFFNKLDLIQFEPNSLCIRGKSIEDRGSTKKAKNIDYLELQENNFGYITISSNNKTIDIKIKDKAKLTEILFSEKRNNIYVDISGLSCRICAPLFNVILENINKKNAPEIKIIYIEPLHYDISKHKVAGVFHDLSEKIDGITPLPTLERFLPDTLNEKSCLISFLGFEGGRYQHICEGSSFEENIPVIGVSGIRIEYPFVAIWGNRNANADGENIWSALKFAKANSIADAYILLHDIHKEQSDYRLKIAPIGTKPHSIASILYTLMHPKTTEIIYDNPKENNEKSKGIGKITITNLNALLSYK